MQSMREIRTVEQGQITLNLPQAFWGREVEIIILDLDDQQSESEIKKSHIRKKSLQGCLTKYAKPELIQTEKDAWLKSIGDKHVPC